MIFRAAIFLAGPSHAKPEEKQHSWTTWTSKKSPQSALAPINVYIADAGLEAFLPWFEALSSEQRETIQSVVWCGDGDSLGKMGHELRAQTAARFAEKWREHEYSGEKDFSDCAAILSLLEYDLRHAGESVQEAWIEVRGAHGGRLDHELANVFEFFSSLTRMPCGGAYLLGPGNILTTLAVSGKLGQGQLFSTMSLQMNALARLKISGAKYSGEIQLRQPSHGLSNCALEEQIEIEPLVPSVPLLVMTLG